MLVTKRKLEYDFYVKEIRLINDSTIRKVFIVNVHFYYGYFSFNVFTDHNYKVLKIRRIYDENDKMQFITANRLNVLRTYIKAFFQFELGKKVYINKN